MCGRMDELQMFPQLVGVGQLCQQLQVMAQGVARHQKQELRTVVKRNTLNISRLTGRKATFAFFVSVFSSQNTAQKDCSG